MRVKAPPGRSAISLFTSSPFRAVAPSGFRAPCSNRQRVSQLAALGSLDCAAEAIPLPPLASLGTSRLELVYGLIVAAGVLPAVIHDRSARARYPHGEDCVLFGVQF